jgi:hypothetical protein
MFQPSSCRSHPQSVRQRFAHGRPAARVKAIPLRHSRGSSPPAQHERASAAINIRRAHAAAEHQHQHAKIKQQHQHANIKQQHQHANIKQQHQHANIKQQHQHQPRAVCKPLPNYRPNES